jgi:hypothetical protein
VTYLESRCLKRNRVQSECCLERNLRGTPLKKLPNRKKSAPGIRTSELGSYFVETMGSTRCRFKESGINIREVVDLEDLASWVCTVFREAAVYMLLALLIILVTRIITYPL